MTRVLFFLWCCAAAGAPQVWCQVTTEGRYHWASLSVKTGVAFEAQVRAGTTAIGKQTGARFTMEDPGGARTLTLAASVSGSVVAGGPASSGQPELFVALRAPDAGQSAALAQGEWSAAMISFEGGKARGLKTAFIDFSVAANGAIVNVSAVSHEAAVDDLDRAEPIELKRAGTASLAVGGVPHSLAIAAAGDMFLATSSASGHASFVLATRRERDATTMSMRGSYALAEIGARNTFAFAPDQARFYAALGMLEANNGQARVFERVALSDSATQFSGSAAYMVSAGGAGAFSPRLEQRRRNLALGSDGSVFITAQVAEAGQLSLLHGVGIGIRVVEMTPPSLALSAMAHGNTVTLYGRHLDGAQVLIGGHAATIEQAWPNQIAVKLSAAPVSPLSVELEWPGGRTAPVAVTLSATAPDFAAAPAAPGGLIAPSQPASPGDTIDVGITGAPPPSGFELLFDGVPGRVVSSSAIGGGAMQLKVTLPKGLAPSPQVNVALASAGYYVDLGDIAVSRPHAPATAAATH